MVALIALPKSINDTDNNQDDVDNAKAVNEKGTGSYKYGQFADVGADVSGDGLNFPSLTIPPGGIKTYHTLDADLTTAVFSTNNEQSVLNQAAIKIAQAIAAPIDGSVTSNILVTEEAGVKTSVDSNFLSFGDNTIAVGSGDQSVYGNLTSLSLSSMSNSASMNIVGNDSIAATVLKGGTGNPAGGVVGILDDDRVDISQWITNNDFSFGNNSLVAANSNDALYGNLGSYCAAIQGSASLYENSLSITSNGTGNDSIIDTVTNIAVIGDVLNGIVNNPGVLTSFLGRSSGNEMDFGNNSIGVRDGNDTLYGNMGSYNATINDSATIDHEGSFSISAPNLDSGLTLSILSAIGGGSNGLVLGGGYKIATGGFSGNIDNNIVNFGENSLLAGSGHDVLYGNLQTMNFSVNLNGLNIQNGDWTITDSLSPLSLSPNSPLMTQDSITETDAVIASASISDNDINNLSGKSGNLLSAGDGNDVLYGNMGSLSWDINANATLIHNGNLVVSINSGSGAASAYAPLSSYAPSPSAPLSPIVTVREGVASISKIENNAIDLSSNDLSAGNGNDVMYGNMQDLSFAITAASVVIHSGSTATSSPQANGGANGGLGAGGGLFGGGTIPTGEGAVTVADIGTVKNVLVTNPDGSTTVTQVSTGNFIDFQGNQLTAGNGNNVMYGNVEDLNFSIHEASYLNHSPGNSNGGFLGGLLSAFGMTNAPVPSSAHSSNIVGESAFIEGNNLQFGGNFLEAGSLATYAAAAVSPGLMLKLNGNDTMYGNMEDLNFNIDMVSALHDSTGYSSGLGQDAVLVATTALPLSGGLDSVISNAAIDHNIIDFGSLRGVYADAIGSNMDLTKVAGGGENTLFAGNGNNVIYGNMEDLSFSINMVSILEHSGSPVNGWSSSPVGQVALNGGDSITATAEIADNHISFGGPGDFFSAAADLPLLYGGLGNNIHVGDGNNLLFGNLEDLSFSINMFSNLNDSSNGSSNAYALVSPAFTMGGGSNVDATASIHDNTVTFESNNISAGNGNNVIFGNLESLEFTICNNSTGLTADQANTPSGFASVLSSVALPGFGAEAHNPGIYGNDITFGDNVISVGNGSNVIVPTVLDYGFMEHGVTATTVTSFTGESVVMISDNAINPMSGLSDPNNIAWGNVTINLGGSLNMNSAVSLVSADTALRSHGVDDVVFTLFQTADGHLGMQGNAVINGFNPNSDILSLGDVFDSNPNDLAKAGVTVAPDGNGNTVIDFAGGADGSITLTNTNLTSITQVKHLDLSPSPITDHLPPIVPPHETGGHG